ncbi:MAG: carboxymuconolactone decarboxylase family protein [Alphaproteobacteria bacterium]
MPRLSKPRVQPRPEEEWDQETRELLAKSDSRGMLFNIQRTLAHHPKLVKRWLVFANHVLFKSSLPPRDREMVILRIGWLCQCDYEWSQHVEIARNDTDLNDTEIARIKAGPDAEGWTAHEEAILRATDELHRDAIIGDATWAELKKTYADDQLMDLVFAVGNYNLVSMALNTLGVELDPFLKGFDH